MDAIWCHKGKKKKKGGGGGVNVACGGCSAVSFSTATKPVIMVFTLSALNETHPKDARGI